MSLSWWTGIRTTRWQATAIGGMIVLLAILTWFTPPRAIEGHNILHHLNFLPLMIAGMLFGWRGALKALLFAALVHTPNIMRHWAWWPMDAQDQIVELLIFGSAGVIAGSLADRERIQRKRVEATKHELERVYTELRQNIEHLKKSERLFAAGQLAASLAHEIRNPLASISGAAGILRRGHASAENTEECLDIMEKESQRLNKLLTNFLDFARPRLPRYQSAEPTAIVKSVVSLARHTAGLYNVELVQELSPDARPIDCDSEQLKQVLLNLIINGVQASEEKGRVMIRSFVQCDRLCIEVEDEGFGIPPESQSRVFDPFFTTKEGGTGLGLAVAANIVAQHGGSLSGRNNAVRGMTFSLELPFERPAKVGMDGGSR